VIVAFTSIIKIENIRIDNHKTIFHEVLQNIYIKFLDSGNSYFALRKPSAFY